ncbi:MAG: hypothetical protein R3F61_35520 [Myxococcota bacterium]
MSFWMLALASASAQDIDAHGFVLAAYDADPRDPLVVQRPGSFQAGNAFVGALFEYARTPLVAVDPDDGARVPLLDNLFALNISAGFAPHERIRFDVAAPLYGYTGLELDRTATTGFGVGDTRIAVMGVLLRPEDTHGFGLALVPHVDLPSGVFDPYLGRNSVAGGGVLAATIEGGPVTASLNGGYQVERTVQLGNLSNSDAVLYGASFGAMLDDTLGLNAEVYGKLPTVSTGVGSTGAPLEVAAALRYAGDGAHFTGGAATGLTQGVGASSVRVFIGGGFGAVGGPRDSDRDGFVDKVDACPNEPETLNGLDDDDGCPDKRPTLKSWVALNGAPKVGAELTIDGPVQRKVTTESEPFTMEVDPDSVWKGTATWGPCLVGEQITNVGTTNAEMVVELEMRTYGEAFVLVVDPTGESVAQAVVEFSSKEPTCVPDRAQRTKPNGEITIPVGPGTHTVRVRSGMKRATATFTAEEGKTVEVVVLLGM